MKSTKEIKSDIRSIRRTGKRLNDDIQTTACDILEHVNAHREVSLANMLVNAVNGSDRQEALRSWFCEFGEIQRHKDDDSRLAFDPTKCGENTEELEELREDGVDTSWLTFKAEKKEKAAYELRKVLEKAHAAAVAKLDKEAAGVTSQEVEALAQLIDDLY